MSYIAHEGKKIQVPGGFPAVSADVEAQIELVTSEPSVGEKIQEPEVTLKEAVAPEEVVGAQIQAPKLTSEEMLDTQIQMPKLTSEETLGVHTQALLVQPITVVSSAPHTTFSSHPPSIGMRDIEGLVSLALADLVATFQLGFLDQADFTSAALTVQFTAIESPMREGSLEAKVASTLGLDFATVVELIHLS